MQEKEEKNCIFSTNKIIFDNKGRKNLKFDSICVVHQRVHCKFGDTCRTHHIYSICSNDLLCHQASSTSRHFNSSWFFAIYVLFCKFGILLAKDLGRDSLLGSWFSESWKWLLWVSVSISLPRNRNFDTHCVKKPGQVCWFFPV